MVRTRREFLADVGRGMFIAGLGPALAADLGLARLAAEEPNTKITFGALEPLVALMQETPADKLMPLVVERYKNGTTIRDLIAAGSLANVRAFLGEDYVGFHTFMSLSPAYEMTKELPEALRLLPVLKVLHRNSSRIQSRGRAHESLFRVQPAELPAGADGGELLREAVRKNDMLKAERTFAALAQGPAGEAFNHLQFTVEDEVDVHRVGLAWRSWVMIDFVGPEHAHTLLRQSVHYCMTQGNGASPHPGRIQAALPKLLDQFKLAGRKPGTRQPDDAWVDQLSQAIVNGSPQQGGEAAAAALAEGFAPAAVAEAISLAANALLLRDPGDPQSRVHGIGTVHGASVGVHASDAANAWRNVARVSNDRNAIASLIAGAYHTAGQAGNLNKQPLPTAEALEKITAKEPDALLAELKTAIEARDQVRACAVVERYGALGHAARSVFDVLVRYATSEEGSNHAEKYYRTVSGEFAATRPAFRWRHLVGLARVTASEFGQKARGYTEGCRLLDVKS